MKSILEINVCIDAVILDAIKLASDKRNGIMAFAYEFIDLDVVSTNAHVGSGSF